MPKRPLDSDILAVAAQYVKWDTNVETRAVIEALIKAGDHAALGKALGSRLTFGTAGLRGPMEAGYAAMNELTVMQATQGLAVYLEEVYGHDAAATGGVAIGWDHRAAGSLNSQTFGLIAAEVLLRRGIRVVLLPGLVHTPMVAYAVLKRKCKAGIMVTASHNPKEDNGYKVYWADGAQIIPPHDKGIATAIDASLEPWAPYGGLTVDALLREFASPRLVDGLGEERPLAESWTEALSAGYFDEMRRALCRFPQENGAASALPIVYTAMHGVGAPWFAKGFDAFGLPPPISVAEQHAPDPTFPTVAFPNPEEGAGALQLAMATAEARGARLVLANDPDADRLAVAERADDGSWHVFTGDQIGVLLADWELCMHARRAGGGRARAAMLSSAVSSRMIAALAHAAGCYWEETLTGFKWLCSRAAALRSEGFEVLLCYEEAIGFCVGGLVNDKDGVSAGAVFAEMANSHARMHGRTVKQHLDHLYRTHGMFTQANSYVICRQPATTAAIFERLRAGGRYWLLLGGLRIEWVRDLTTGVDTDAPDGRATLPLSSSSHMITYRFANGATVTLRGSGTEPKIKWYAESKGQPGESRAEITKQLSDLVDLVVEQMLQPEANGLEARKA